MKIRNLLLGALCASVAMLTSCGGNSENSKESLLKGRWLFLGMPFDSANASGFELADAGVAFPVGANSYAFKSWLVDADTLYLTVDVPAANDSTPATISTSKYIIKKACSDLLIISNGVVDISYLRQNSVSKTPTKDLLKGRWIMFDGSANVSGFELKDNGLAGTISSFPFTKWDLTDDNMLMLTTLDPATNVESTIPYAVTYVSENLLKINNGAVDIYYIRD